MTPRTTSEIHRIATIDNLGSIKVYISPVLNRLHSVSSSRSVSYDFDVDETGAVLLTLHLGEHNYGADEIIHSRNLFSRLESVIEDYISANRGSDGCVMCGAAAKQQCLSTCGILEAELCLGSLRHVIAKGSSR